MLIEIPDHILKNSNLTEYEFRRELALTMYEKNLMTLEQASDFAKMDAYEFQKITGERRIPIHYSEQGFEDDLATIKKFLK